MGPDAIRILELLERERIVAVVGASHRPERPSHRIGSYLIDRGFQVLPINPNESEVFGHVAYADLASLPSRPTVVVVFRRSSAVPPVVEDAIASGARALWLQEGVIHDAACARAREAGLLVVQDRCIMVDHARWKSMRDA